MSGALRLIATAFACASLAWISPAAAAPPDPAVAARARALIPFLNGDAKPASQFAPAFLAQVPEAQLSAVTAQLRAALGPAREVIAITSEGRNAATIAFAYARGMVTMRLVVSEAAPHLITGLLVTNTQVSGDSFARLALDFALLSGSSGFTAARLGGPAPVVIARRNDGIALAVGSAFKLYVLAELARSIGAGERTWSNVVPLVSRSLPSGILHDWPRDAPVTLHTLAALMISRSDNSATDRLIDLLGRDRVEAAQALAGHSDPARNMPFLTTGEMFLLKGEGGKALLERWTAGDAAARRLLLTELGKVDRARFDYGNFAGPPNAIDTVEWFASPRDLVNALDWLRTNGDATTRDILAINPGIGAAAAADYTYLGFKGGSESGVVNLSFLVQSKAGAWFAVTGSWNDPKATLDENRFVALMARAVALTAR